MSGIEVYFSGSLCKKKIWENKMNIQVGKSYKDNRGNVWECVAVDLLYKETALDFLSQKFPDYNPNPAPYEISFDSIYTCALVDHERKYYESCKTDGVIYSRHSLDEEIVPAEKVPVKKTFVMHKHSKSFFCVDEKFNFCLFDDENETRYNVDGSGGINWKFYIKVNISFDEYLELTGLKRKDNLADCKLKLLNSFGCQTSLLAPILKKVEELLSEISNAKANKLALKNLEKLAVKSVMELFSEKMRKLGGAFVMEEDEIRTTKMFLEYIELFEKQLTKTAN